MPDIVLKNKNGEDVTYQGIESVTFDTPIEGEQATYSYGVKEEKTLALDMASGNQEIVADDGKVLSKVTIEKPANLLAENIKNGVTIGGVEGNFIGNVIEDVPIELDLSKGNQTITAPEGYLVKSAIIQKPEMLMPQNIAKDVEIAGVVGTLESGGGALVEKAVNFWDYDGKLLYSYTIDEAHALTELPEGPIHDEQDFFTFSGWSVTLNNIQTEPAFREVFALYKPIDSATYGTDNASLFYVRIAGKKALDLYCYKGSSSIKAFVNWGDGTIQEITATSATSKISHTYAEDGLYTISIVSSGIVYFGGKTDATRFMYGSEWALLSFVLGPTYHYPTKYAFSRNYHLKKACILGFCNNDYPFYYCHYLRVVSVGSVYSLVFPYCNALSRVRCGGTAVDVYKDSYITTLAYTGTSIKSFPTAVRFLILTSTSKVTYSSSPSPALDCATYGTKIYVPDNLVETYKADSSWGAFADYIYGHSEINHNEILL